MRHAGLDAEAVQHEQQIFGGKVARGAGREGAAAQAAGGAVERRHAVIEAGEHVGEGGAARVVEVQGDLMQREPGADGSEDTEDVARSAPRRSCR